MQDTRHEKEEMRQLRRMKIMTNMTRKIKAKGRVDANNSWQVSELLDAGCKKSVASSGMGGYSATMAQYWLFDMKKKTE